MNHDMDEQGDPAEEAKNEQSVRRQDNQETCFIRHRMQKVPLGGRSHQFCQVWMKGQRK